ncbi:HlyD family type I secretion periplasmic adaptor subunit [Amorphus sp. 3PC139-8]|uniref:HlyD family type I secretion periplasmic adaptor subunit n=1 Tax=Amorphus sp. 3PC139-8 TaxID=2735676 RepID=UPI00345D243F
MRDVSNRQNSEHGSSYAASARYYIAVGIAILFAFFGSLTAWSAIAPLMKGAVAPGVVTVEGNRRTIQHLEGGIVREINVFEGEMVEKGQTLVVLDEIQAQSKVEIIKNRYWNALARQARLQAQRDGSVDVQWPRELSRLLPDPIVKAIIDSQQAALTTQVESLEGQQELIRKQIEQARRQIDGIEAQNVSLDRQLELIKMEEADAQTLYDKDLLPRPRLLALQRERAKLSGQIASNSAEIARTEQQISESTTKLLYLKTSYMEKVLDELQEVDEEASSLKEQFVAAQDVLSRIVIKAPVSGQILNLSVHTIGGVVKPGQALLDIVPSGDDLKIDAKVNPLNKDVVHTGMPASVVFTSYNQRTHSPVPAVVEHVSGDAVEDERTGATYYKARLRVDRSDLTAIGLDDVELVPGMPVEVYLKAGQRTAFEYIIEPISDAARRGLVGE